MKRKILFILCVLCTLQSLSAQNINFTQAYQTNVPNVILSTPHSQTFEKYINHKVQEYNGLADISIHLGEISIKGISLPIILSYHPSGVRYMQMDGDLGAGWSINVGGYRISRSIHGKSDLDYFLDSGIYISRLDSVGDYYLADRYMAQIATYYGRSNLGAILPDNAISYLDGEYDQFTYNTPTTSGNFIVSQRGQNYPGIALNRANDKISISKKTGIITDDMGNNYYFGSYKDKTFIETTILSDPQENQEIGWPLVELSNIHGESILFDYVSYIHSPFRKNDYVSYEISNAASGTNIGQTVKSELPPSTTNSSPQSYRNGSFQKYNVQTFYVNNIQSPVGSVNFLRTAKNENNSPNLLNSIEIRDNNHVLIKKIMFDYKKSPEQPTENTPWHYLLTSVKLVHPQESTPDKVYKFYYDEINLPYAYPDQWGYYNAGNQQQMYLHDEFLNETYVSNLNHINGVATRKTLRSLANSSTYFAQRSKATHSTAFSLGKIVYPTGGYTEYEFEPHKYGSYAGGGLRVKSIVTKEKEGSPVLKTLYQYSNGVPSFNLNQDNFNSLYLNMWFSGQANIEFWYNAKKNYSMTPTGDVPLSDFKVSYKDVQVANYTIEAGTDTVFNGKTEFKFLIPERYKTSPMCNSSDPHKLPVTMPLMLNLDYNMRNSVINVTEYALGYQPQLQEKRVLNCHNQVVSKELYEYEDADNGSFNGIKVSQKVFFSSNMHDTSESAYRNKWTWVTYMRPLIEYHGDDNLKYHAYNYIRSFFDFQLYTIKVGKLIPVSQKVITYSHVDGKTDSIATHENFAYDSVLRLTNLRQTNSINNVLEKEMMYPTPESCQHLINKNMINVVLKTVTKNDFTNIGTIETIYPEGEIYPSEVNSSAGDISRIDFTYDSYDPVGNIRQLTTIDGITTIYIWSYNGQYPIAEIREATYDEVAAAIEVVFNGMSVDELTKTAFPIESGLIDGSLQRALPNASVTTFTYKPFVGIATITDPREFTTWYSYDNFNRLREIYYYGDANKSNKLVLEVYDYNYSTNPW